MKQNPDEVLETIHNIIEAHADSIEHLGVLSGLSGITLFQFYYAEYIKDKSISNKAIDSIGQCIEKINSGYAHPTFCTGIAGLTWTLNHLEQEEFIDLDALCLEDFDSFLYQCMLEDIKEKNYDYLHGAIGYALYFLERHKKSNSVSKSKYESYLQFFLQFLSDIAVPHKQGVIWLTPDPVTKLQNYNLSLSHGVSSIISILRQLSCLPAFKIESEKILKAAIASLLQEKNNLSLYWSYFPSWTDLHGKDYPKNSRLAWCYGDLGIGVQLLYCSKTLKSDDLYGEAIKILRHAATRRDYEQTTIEDAAVCHGSFGVALVFNNIYKNTSEPIFKEATDYWLDHGLQLARKDDMLLKEKTKEGRELSLLTGLSGIGLTIISCFSNLNEWETSLMLEYYE